MKFLNRSIVLVFMLVATGIGLSAAEDGVMAKPVAKPSCKELAVSRGYGCPVPNFKSRSRLLFQGDSIADMGRDKNPETKDRNHYLGHSYVFLLAARLGVEMADAQLDFINRGISGNTVGDLRQRWEKDTLDVKPDVLTILIGTNNVGLNKGLDTFEADYRAILDASRKANPEIRLVLMDPFVLKSGNLKNEQAWTSRRAATDKLCVIVAELAEEYDALHIKTQDIFDAAAAAVSPEHWIWDGIHPLPQGQELIARHWLQEVSARWP